MHEDGKYFLHILQFLQLKVIVKRVYTSRINVTISLHLRTLISPRYSIGKEIQCQ